MEVIVSEGGHGENYVKPQDILWWSYGGELHGTSPEKITGLRRILNEAPRAMMGQRYAISISDAGNIVMAAFLFWIKGASQTTLKMVL